MTPLATSLLARAAGDGGDRLLTAGNDGRKVLFAPFEPYVDALNGGILKAWGFYRLPYKDAFEVRGEMSLASELAIKHRDFDKFANYLLNL